MDPAVAQYDTGVQAAAAGGLEGVLAEINNKLATLDNKVTQLDNKLTKVSQLASRGFNRQILPGPGSPVLYEAVPFDLGEHPVDDLGLPVIQHRIDIANLSIDDLKTYLQGYGRPVAGSLSAAAERNAAEDDLNRAIGGKNWRI